MSQRFATDYIDVAARLVELREKHPEASLQPANPEKPFEVLTVGDRTFIVYGAACYRTPGDPRPGIGYAYEPFPGTTNFTRNSELQNAETSAWGRAIVAALAADTKQSVASAEEVRNRQAERDEPAPPRRSPASQPVQGRALDEAADLKWEIVRLADERLGMRGEDGRPDVTRLAADFADWWARGHGGEVRELKTAPKDDLVAYRQHLYERLEQQAAGAA